MGCNCKWCETVLAIVIIVFAFWETVASQWIVVIAAILLLIHAWSCKNCAMPASSSGKKKSKR
jgi:hypothetical protein